MVQKQFDSAVESIISTGENDSDFDSKYKQPVDLTVERLASTSDLHFDSIVASCCKKMNNMTRRSNYLPQRAQILTQRANILFQRAKNNVNLLELCTSHVQCS